MSKIPKEAKYLGNSLFFGRNKIKDYDELRKRVEARLQGWKVNLLFQASRYILVEFVITSIPIYTMSSCKLSHGWCRHIDKPARRLLWKGNASLISYYTLVSWKKIYRPKLHGGLGIRKLEDINIALPCKLRWSLENNFDLLWVKALKAKYFPFSSFMHCVWKRFNPWQWNGIPSIRSVLAKGICFRVVQGNNINYCKDPWIPNNPNFQPIPNLNVVDMQCRMVEPLMLSNGEWNKLLLESLFDKDSVNNIIKIFQANDSLEDKLIWTGSSSGKFQLKSVYKFLNPIAMEDSNWWRCLWNSNIHDRLKFFMWKLLFVVFWCDRLFLGVIGRWTILTVHMAASVMKKKFISFFTTTLLGTFGWLSYRVSSGRIIDFLTWNPVLIGQPSWWENYQSTSAMVTISFFLVF